MRGLLLAHLVVVCVLGAATLAVPAEERQFTGTVVDATGKPVTGVELCQQSGPANPGAIPRCLGKAAVTDAQGHFAMPPPPWGGFSTLLAFDPFHKIGAVVQAKSLNLTNPVRIELHPAQAVAYHLRPAVAVAAPSITAHFYSLPSQDVLGYVLGADGIIMLPPGKYEISARFPDTDFTTHEFQVTDHSLQLPPLHFKLEKMATYYGNGTPHIAPLTDMERMKFRVGAITGHWTLLYFWQESCGPCIQHGLPELIAFAETHPIQTGNLRILAVHTRFADAPANWPHFHDSVQRLESNVWHDVPTFPMLYDEYGTTSKNWGIHIWPTYGLIDPKGNLVRVSDFKDVQKAIGLTP